jgi:large subunit ribosomal protein L32
MSVPKHRKNKSRVRTKRAHHALKTSKAPVCSKCGAPRKPHTACPSCGDYKGKKVIATKADIQMKREDKRKKREEKDKQKMRDLKNK